MKSQAGIIGDIQASLARLACPFCKQGKLDLVLRCDVHAEECLFISRCQHCQMQYLVDLDSAPSLPVENQPQHPGAEMSCTRCGNSDCTVTFRCTVASRRCAYETVCAACQNAEARLRPAAGDRRAP